MQKAFSFTPSTLDPVANVCNQILREVWTAESASASLAHVEMEQGNVSLLHKHEGFEEIYYVLSGEGDLHVGDDIFHIKSGSLVEIPRGNPHKLFNTGSGTLTHLVFSVPEFDVDDVVILEGKDIDYKLPEQKGVMRSADTSIQPFKARDGALIWELMRPEISDVKEMSIAEGKLNPAQVAIPHYHKESEELYWVLSGNGSVRVGDVDFDITEGSVVYVPTQAIHALTNRSDKDEMRILAISVPAYKDEDIFFVDK